MVNVPVAQLDIDKIARSGQCFRMHRVSDGCWSIINGTHYLEAKQPADADEVTFDCGQQEFDELWRDYFDLDTDYDAFIDSIDPADEFLTKAAEFSRGIRILKQDLWEIICTFIISQNNNMKRIGTSVNNLCQELGEPHEERGVTFHSFPEPSRLMDPSLIRLFGIGYRTPHLCSVARDIYSGTLDLEALATTDNRAAVHRTLIGIPGVGPKVAACIELFGLHWLDAYPIDTWMRKVIERRYQGEFDWSRYHGYEGVIQQYLFCYERKVDREEELSRVPSARRS